MKKKILITGASGFIGINLIKSLMKSKQYKIVGTYFKSKKFYKIKNVKYIKVNLENKKSCKKICKDIDVVVMCAANSSGAEVMEKTPLVHMTPNIRMNLNMLEAAYLNSVNRFIFISSNTVYPVSDLPMKEKDAKFSFFNKYHIVGWMKRFTEIVCEIYSRKINQPMQTIIVRPGNLYGPHDKFDPKKSKVVPSLISKIVKKNKTIDVWGDGKDLKDFLYIEDFCEALVKIIDIKKKMIKNYQVLNVAKGKSITILQILKILIKINKRKMNEVIFDKSKPTMIPKRQINISKIKKFINYKPRVSIEEGLTKTVSWYKKNYL